MLRNFHTLIARLPVQEYARLKGEVFEEADQVHAEGGVSSMVLASWMPCASFPELFSSIEKPTAFWGGDRVTKFFRRFDP